MSAVVVSVCSGDQCLQWWSVSAVVVSVCSGGQWLVVNLNNIIEESEEGGGVLDNFKKVLQSI